ncbi:hypothetical protein Tco_0672366 [Tanacetum coccineum]
MVTLPGASSINPFPPDFNPRIPETKTPTTNFTHFRDEDVSVRKERKEAVNKKIASQKAISVVLRREATMAVIEKKKGMSRLFPGTVLEALHERITASRWESALKFGAAT